jgi:Putative metal-binding motif
LNVQMLTCARCGGLTPLDSSRDCLHCDAPLWRPTRWTRRLTALLGPAGALLLAACYGAPGRYYNVREPGTPDGASRADRDHDGVLGAYECTYGNVEACKAQLARLPPPSDVDCDDTDPARFPGAADVDGDGVDSNCDGVDGWRDPAVVAEPPVIPSGAAEPVTEPMHVATPPAP